MADLPDWPDAELLIRAVLLDLASVGTEVPADPSGTYSWLPFLRVQCFGGGNIDTATNVFRFDVDTFAATKGAASQLAGRVRQRLLSAPHFTAQGQLDVAKAGQPYKMAYGDEDHVIRYTSENSGSARRTFS